MSSVNCPNSDGIEPSKLLYCKARRLRAVNCPISDGIVPVKELYQEDTSSEVRAVNCPNSDGIEPYWLRIGEALFLRETLLFLPDKCITSNDDSRPYWLDIGVLFLRETRLLLPPDKFSTSNDDSRPYWLGIERDNPLSGSSNATIRLVEAFILTPYHRL